jgi:hypothetical protein
VLVFLEAVADAHSGMGCGVGQAFCLIFFELCATGSTGSKCWLRFV